MTGCSPYPTRCMTNELLPCRWSSMMMHLWRTATHFTISHKQQQRWRDPSRQFARMLFSSAETVEVLFESIEFKHKIRTGSELRPWGQGTGSEWVFKDIYVPCSYLLAEVIQAGSILQTARDNWDNFFFDTHCLDGQHSLDWGQMMLIGLCQELTHPSAKRHW